METKPVIQLEDESERTSIRQELSDMSFEQLLRLKEQLGLKVYNEAVFGTVTSKHADFKRANKNRPREQSSKLPASPMEVFTVKKKVARDPRFDSLCGTFNEKLFRSSYSFLGDVKQQELRKLREELKATKDPDRKDNIKYLIQRLENQERAGKLRRLKEQKQAEEREARVATLLQGVRPKPVKPAERRVLQLVDRYEELKARGKLKKHIEKQRKKAAVKDRKKLKEQRRVVE